MLQGLVDEVIPQSELGVSAVAETESTFAGNALLKARHAARVTGLPALADDSGLEVDALAGAPGVWSARYAGEAATDAQNNAKLLSALVDVPAPRRARYRAVLALVTSADDPQPVMAEGSWEGEIALRPAGEGGFGYDPLFLVDGGPLTAAQLEARDKNLRSHRAMALARLVDVLRGP
jgi:XTP/dITP diphosphohydrolase